MSSEPNLYQRKPGSVYWLRAVVRGVECRESLRTRDVKVARRLRDKRLKEIEGEARGEKRILWAQAVASWLGHVEGQRKAPSTIKRYKVSLKQCESFLLTVDVKAIDGALMAKIINARQAAGATQTTVRRDLTAISQVLKYCEAQEWREGNPTLSKRTILEERRDPIELPREEDIRTVLAHSSARFSALIIAARLTGCRQNELVTAKWEGYNRGAKTLEVIGKGNKRRTLKLSDSAAAHFRAHPRTLGSDLIFCREGGLQFAEAASDFTYIRRVAALSAKRQNIEFRRFRFHDLRHLFAVEALRDGMDIYTLSKHLGHTSVMTTEIYLEFLTPGEQEAAKAGASPGSAQNQAQQRRSEKRKG